MQSAKFLEVVQPRTPSGPFSGDAVLEEFSDFNDVALRITHPRGMVLFAEGQPAAGVYLLCAGRAKVSISSSEGKVVIMRIARSGDLLGVDSVLKGRPHDATVETLERCRLGFISTSNFISLLDRSKAARTRVSQYLCDELSELTESARLLLLSQSAQEKLVRLLLKWYDELGEPTSEGTRLNHGLTHEEIGQMICASRETVSRLLTELKRRQIVRLDGAGLLVHSRTALELTSIRNISRQR
jgi:CRP/FNR family transcriptional regulator, cyclic AMP receptor protein